MAFDSSRPFPLIRNKTLNIAALLRKKSGEDEELEFAMVQVPSVISRIVELPREIDEDGKERRVVILLEEIIERNMPSLFLNYDIVASHPFRIMRNADLTIDEEEAVDLLEEIQKQLKKRQWGEAIRLEIEDNVDKRLLKIIRRELSINSQDIFEINGPLDLTFLMRMYGLEGFELFKVPADIKIIAPWRMTDVWTMQSREDEIEYCKQHGIDLPFSADSSYSRDRNLWHISHEGLELEDPSQEPNYEHLLVLGVTPEKAPDEGEYVTMTFEKGVPTSVNGEKMKVSDIIRKLNELGGKHGIGIVDIVENRVVGMKSRGVYETPGGTILMEAHQQLEELVLDRATMETKKTMADKLAQIVYEGKWFTPLREAVQAFVESTQEYVTGEVKFKLYKGNIIKADSWNTQEYHLAVY